MAETFVKTAIKRFLPEQVRWVQSRRKYWRDYWRDGEWELRELSKIVPRDKLAIDVGGDGGVYTYHLSRLAKSVVTFEPDPGFVAQLMALKLKNVRVEPVALSSQAGVASLRVPRLNGVPERGMGSLERAAVSDAKLGSQSDIETRTLDHYGFENVGFIKIDVEGHEESVLRGAANTIARNGPALLIEIEEAHNPDGLTRIADHLATLGYAGFFFERRERRRLQDFDAAVDQRPLSDQVLALVGEGRRKVRYINNFLFLRAQEGA